MRRPTNHRRSAGILLWAISCALFGCRHADLQREIVEREMRLQEDELYRAHDLIASRERMIESVRQENASLKRDLEQARGGGSAVPPDLTPSMPPAPTGQPPTRTPRPRNGGIPQIDIQPPTIEVPPQQAPPAGAPPAGGEAPNRSSMSAPRIKPASHQVVLPEIADTPARESRIAAIALNQRLTGGFDADKRFGDEGITVVVEPRDHSGRIVRQSGRISVALIDPALPGEAGRVARWDFSAQEVEQRVRDGVPTEGIHLELRWPARPPEHEELMVFARLTTADGQRHEASQSILVDLGSDSQGIESHRTADRSARIGWSPDR
jgi:hypothetical protein